MKSMKRVIIVLGNKIIEKVKLNDVTKARAQKAIEVFKTYNYGEVKMLAMGWRYSKDVDISLATAIKQYLIEEGIDGDMIRCCEESKDTVGDALFSRRDYIDKRNIEEAIIVTSKSHMERCKKIFSYVYRSSRCRLKFKCAEDHSYAHEAEKEKESMEIFRKTFEPERYMRLDEIEKIMREKHKLYISRQEN